MTKQKVNIPSGERAVWWCSVIGSVIVLAAALPLMPWRYARVDTNCGNRYVMERFYYLTGVTNNLGKTEGWMSIRRKMQRANEQFGRPSPLVAIAGTVAQSIGAGGAAMGCPMWMACKEHTSVRYSAYSTIAYSSFAFIGSALLQALFSALTLVYLGFEQDARAKGKKKKKKDDDSLQPPTQTAIFAVLAFLFAFIMSAGFIISTLVMFKRYKETAYYPFAGAHAASFVASIGCILLFISAFHCLTRAGLNFCYTLCCGKKEPEWWENGDEWAGDAYGGGYGGGYGKGGYGW